MHQNAMPFHASIHSQHHVLVAILYELLAGMFYGICYSSLAATLAHALDVSRVPLLDI
jgi:hypothetical protein